MDLDAIKDATRILLYIDPEQDEQFPFIVHHPFFSNSMCFDGEMFFDLFEEPDRARKGYDVLIDKAGTLADILVLVRDPYRMLWFSMCAPYIDDPGQYADVLKHCWVTEEWPSRDVNVDMDMMVRLFEGADRDLMVPDPFPEKMKVWRGVNRGGSPYGMSWTLNKGTAEWFANRLGRDEWDGEVYEMEVDKADVLAYIEERGEAEVVIDARGRDVVKVGKTR